MISGLFLVVCCGVLLVLYDNVLSAKQFNIKLRSILLVGFGLIALGFIGLAVAHSFMPVVPSYVINILFPSNLDALIIAVSKLMWPVITLVAILILKKPIEDLIGRMRQWEYDIKEKKLRFEIQGTSTNQSQSVANQISHPLTFPNEPEIVQTRIAEIQTHLNLGNQTSQQKEAILLSTIASVTYRAQFETAYNKIYGTQIKALQHLRMYGNGPLGSFFAEHEKRVAEAKIPNMPTPNLTKWQEFLLNYQFITIERSDAAITNVGRAFIEYLEQSNYSLERAF